MYSLVALVTKLKTFDMNGSTRITLPKELFNRLRIRIREPLNAIAFDIFLLIYKPERMSTEEIERILEHMKKLVLLENDDQEAKSEKTIIPDIQRRRVG